MSYSDDCKPGAFVRLFNTIFGPKIEELPIYRTPESFNIHSLDWQNDAANGYPILSNPKNTFSLHLQGRAPLSLTINPIYLTRMNKNGQPIKTKKITALRFQFEAKSPEEALSIYHKTMKSIGWKHLPATPDLLNQMGGRLEDVNDLVLNRAYGLANKNVWVIRVHYDVTSVSDNFVRALQNNDVLKWDNKPQ